MSDPPWTDDPSGGMASIADEDEVLVTGAVFAILHSWPGTLNVTIDDDSYTAVEFGLDFMRSRYKVTIERADS